MRLALIAVPQSSAGAAGIGAGRIASWVTAGGIPESSYPTGVDGTLNAWAGRAGAKGHSMHGERVTPAGLQLQLAAPVLAVSPRHPAQVLHGSGCLEAATVCMYFPPPPGC